jgi:hypothetical protein
MLSRHRSLGAVLIGVAALLAACQTAPATPGGDAVASPAHNTPGTASGSAPTASPGEDAGRPTGVSDGRVHVTVTPVRPASGGTIQVVVANGLDRAIYTDDAKADCSIVTLQRLDGTTWRDVPGCAQQRPPATVAIGPAHARTVTLHPASSNFRIRPDSRIDPGTYRVRCTYRLTPDQQGDDPEAAESEPFTIG